MSDKRTILLILLFLTLPFQVVAQTPATSAGAGGKGAPLEIEADNSLEWDRNNFTFMAKGNAMAKKGDTTVKADKLIAHYTEGTGGEVTINKIIALGNARAEKEDDIITAKEMTAYLDENNRLSVIEVSKNVVIKTPNEKAQGNKAVYYLDKEQAVLTGNVKLIQGPNILLGERAEFNMKTNIARLSATGNNGEKGRVRGVFYTEKDRGL